jgi:hypothetical protein
MTVAARKIEWETWSQSRFLAWAETQPGFCHYEFDGFQPISIAPVTIGHNRIGRNIREAIRPRLPAGRRAVRRLRAAGRDRNSRRRPAGTGRLDRVFPAAPDRDRRAGADRFVRGRVAQREAIGGGTKRRSRSTNRCPRYSAMLLWNPRDDRSERSGANRASGRGAGRVWTRLDRFACQSLGLSCRLMRFILGSILIKVGGNCGSIDNASIRKY